jgi:DNA primase
MDDVTRYNDNLVAVDGIYSWLYDCGINLAAAHRLQFGACANKGGFPRKDANGKDTNGFYACRALCVPHRDRAGQLIGLLWRDVENKNFTSAPGSRTDGLYAALHVDYNSDEVLVLEGSKDVAIAMSHGFNSVGIPSASYKLSDEDETILRQFKRVYLIPDNDEQGQGVRAMERIVERLLTVKERVTLVHLPVGVKDIGEFFKKNRLDFKSQLEGILGRK